MRCVEERRGSGSNVLTDAKKRLQVQSRGMLGTAAKKFKIVKPGDNVMVPVPDLDRAKIDAHSQHAVIVREFSNGQFKLGTRYFLNLAGNKINTPLCTERACCPEPSPGTSFQFVGVS